MDDNIRDREELYNKRFRPLYIKLKRGLFLSESEKTLVNQMLELRQNLLYSNIFIDRAVFLKFIKAYINDEDEFVIFAIVFRRQFSECLEDSHLSHVWSLTNEESKKFFQITSKQREFGEIIHEINKLIGHMEEHILLENELKISKQLELHYNKLLELSRS